MKIESVEIHNFRQFKGETKLSFSLQKKKNVTVVTARMEVKNFVTNVFKWCFMVKQILIPVPTVF